MQLVLIDSVVVAEFQADHERKRATVITNWIGRGGIATTGSIIQPFKSALY